MTATPSSESRIPSSARAVKMTVPSANWKLPAQRTEKLSTGRPGGPPAPQSLLMTVSHAVRVAGGVSAMLLKYCAKNWPSGHALEPTVNGSEFDVCRSGFRSEERRVVNEGRSEAG